MDDSRTGLEGTDATTTEEGSQANISLQSELSSAENTQPVTTIDPQPTLIPDNAENNLAQTFFQHLSSPEPIQSQSSNDALALTSLATLLLSELESSIPDLISKSNLSSSSDPLTNLRKIFSQLSTESPESFSPASLKTQIARQATSNLTGICATCNNLRPDGHEDSFENYAGGLKDQSSDAMMREARAEFGKMYRAIVLDGIAIGEVRDSALGRPYRGRERVACRYCAFLCSVLVEFYGEYAMERRWEGDRRKLKLSICEGRPLVIGCQSFRSDPDWAHVRDDYEVYRVEEEGVDELELIGRATEKAERSDDEQAFGWIKECYAECMTEHSRCSVKEESEGRHFGIDCDGELCCGVTDKSYIAGVRYQCTVCHDTDFCGKCVGLHDRSHTLTESHASGAKRSDSTTPMRLLYVGTSDDELKLVERSNIPKAVSFAALSHCWGASSILRLLTHNHTRLLRHVSHEDLPNTFQNAITVARLLDLQYVWIDSLCIIQDSASDWETNAAVMGQIYTKATSVISASLSPNPWTSFLFNRPAEHWGPRTIPFPTSNNGTHPVKVRKRHTLASPLEQGLKEPPYTMSWATLLRNGPLHRRAWAFQESLLASRIIHFHPGGLSWECKTHRRDEGSLPPYSSTVTDSLGKISEMEKWHRTIKSYSRRKLTRSSDRLPAISGVARIFAERGARGAYVAGLWQDTFALDLLWQIMPGSQPIATAFREYVAPSWSWASVDRGVVWTKYQDPEQLVQIPRVACPPKVGSVNPYGEIGRSVLVVSGSLVPIKVRSDGRPPYEYFASYKKKDGASSAEQWFMADGLLVAMQPRLASLRKAGLGTWRRARKGENGGSSETLDAYFLPVARTGRWAFGDIGLVLASVQEDAAIDGCLLLTRIGNLSNVTRDWAESGTETMFAIM